MKTLTRWAEALCITAVLQLSFSSNLVTAAGWTSSRKLEARNKTRDLWYHGFDAYYKYAFPLDELTPLSCSGKGPDWENPANIVYNDVAGNYSLTLVDVLDSFVVLDDYTGFDRAVRDTIGWVSFNSNTKPQVFETTIRVLGGLLSAHQFASDPKQRFYLPWYKDELLKMAKDLGERLLPAFETPTGIPYARLNLRHGVQAGESIETCTAGAGSLLLEFATLSRLTGDDRFEKAAYKAYFALWNRRSDINLVGNTINIVNGKWNHPEVSSVGAGIDSFYEYALKFYILSGETEFLDVWTESYASIMRYVRTMNGFTFSSSNIHSGDMAYHMTDSLSAFWPGLQVLAGDVENAIKSHQIYWNIWKTYSGLPEVFDLSQKVATSSQYPLRPEFIESTWYLYRATRDSFYLDVGERVLRDLSHRAVVECGLTGIQDLKTNARDDRMESFVLSETLKYLYLLFDEANPLNSDDSNYVLTTEGHIIMMDMAQIRPISPSRRKIRGPNRSQCPAYQPWLLDKARQDSSKGLTRGIWQRADMDYARTLVNAPHVASDTKHWSVEGWCTVPPVQLYTYDFILSTTGKSVPEELSPSSGKVSHVDDGYVVHNITGLRAHIVSRLDGKGYDLTKIGPYIIRSGQSVYFDDPDLIAAVNQLNAAKASVAQRKAEVQLHIFSDILDPVISAQGTLEEFPSDDVVFTGFTSSFGGDPATISSDGTSPLTFGRGDGVPVVQAWNNTYGCLPFTEKFHDEAIVVHRGQCTFFEKLVRAMDAGASGVIVIDDDDNGIHPSAEKKEIEDVGDGLNRVALVVIQRSAGKVLERMLTVADDLDATIWLMVHPEAASSKSPPTEPTPTTEPKMLYINGHGLINTRLLP